MHILVTGGAGFIGSHTVVALLDAGHTVVVADNLSNSKKEMITTVEKITGQPVEFHEIDVTNEESVARLFEMHQFDGVIHFAGLKAVGESVEKPLLYYMNNLVSTMVIAQACVDYDVHKIVFSSSATVYGDNRVPFHEKMPLLPTTNPYGETKAMCERILMDLATVTPNLGISLLRYFNPVGAHKSGLIGESPNGIPNNLMPFVTQVAKGKLSQVQVFGDDYDTVDGSGVRDYIHVVDLAEGHVAAIEQLQPGTHIYNLGTGRGTSVLQLIEAFEKVNNISVPYKIVNRRPGDITSCYADVTKANRELGWVAKYGIEEMCKDAWNFERKREASRL